MRPVRCEFLPLCSPQANISAEGKNPSIAILRKQGTAPPIRYIDPTTFTSVLQTMTDPAYRIAIRLGRGSGLRPFEGGKIENSLMPQTSTASIFNNDHFEVIGKGGHRRFPEIDPELMEEINRYRFDERPNRVRKYRERHDGQEPTALLLNGKNGDPISYHGLYQAFRKACTDLNVEARLHWLRHAYACDHMADFVVKRLKAIGSPDGKYAPQDIEALITIAQIELMILLGHAHIGTTNGYLGPVRHAIACKLRAEKEKQ